jgi:hypothetical protein
VPQAHFPALPHLPPTSLTPGAHTPALPRLALALAGPHTCFLRLRPLTPGARAPTLSYPAPAPAPPLRQVIAIDEAQFFGDLVEFCAAAADEEAKHVIVAGLDGDFQRRRFGQVRARGPRFALSMYVLCWLC